MPKLLHRLPKYRRHSSRNVAFVVLNGQRQYLPGKYGSDQSRREYRRLCLEWDITGRPSTPVPKASDITIAEMLIAYWRFAEKHYVKHGRPTDEQACTKAALRFVKELYADTPAAEFSPLKLKAVRERMVQAGGARSTINLHCSRIRRLFRWAASEELLPVSVWQSLSSLPGLQRGRTTAREPSPVLPVDAATVEATLPHLPPTVADMVRLQRLCGMRPMEVCQLRECDVDRSAEIWRYVPLEWKMEHKGRQRVIFIGPQAQVILKPYLERAGEVYCFSPQESESQRRAEVHAERTTPLHHGNTIGTNRKRRPKRQPSDRYDVDAYRRAITRACEVAFGMPEELRRIPETLPTAERDQRRKRASEWRAKHCWAPNQLRHSAATAIREAFGIEAAQSCLGHSKPNTTLVYAEKSERLAADVARKLG